MPNRTEPEP